jgi:hypothetical protein
MTGSGRARKAEMEINLLLTIPMQPVLDRDGTESRRQSQEEADGVKPGGFFSRSPVSA